MHWGLLRASAAVVVAVSLLGAPLALHAQETGSGDAEARALFSAAEIAFGDGRWEAALDYFQRAYDLSHRPMLLFNIGSSAEHLRRDDVALAAFREYLVQLPDATNRAAVESRIAILERAVASTHTAPPPDTIPTSTSTETATSTATTSVTSSGTSGASAPSTEPHVDAAPVPDASASGGSDPAPWIMAGIGGAVLVAGAVLVGVGFANIGAVTGARDGVPLSEISGAHDSAPILTGTGWAALGLGIALVAVGIGWGVSSGGGTSEAHVTATAWADNDGGGVAVWGAFR